MPTLDRRQFSPSAARNRDPILAVLQRVLPAAGLVLEIGSGTGEHAVHFARHLPALRWQPSDADPAAMASITDWVAHSALPNLLPPLCFDLAATPWPVDAADAVVAINVLNGTMSLVGPRPHAVCHNSAYSKQIAAYMARHRIKPGITGLAQVRGWRGETDTVEKMQRRVDYDLDYINNWSLKLDLWILLMTPIALIRDRAY